jgi:hypothetical protein
MATAEVNGKPKKKRATKRDLTFSCNQNQDVAKRKVALIGKAPSSMRLAPYSDPTWEIWTLNTSAHLNEVPRWDVHFELHDIELTKDPGYGKYYEWLQKESHGDRPIYLRNTIPDGFGASAKPYPLPAILKTFSNFVGREYITNTVSLMLALLIEQHVHGQPVEQVGLWGVDMAQHGVPNGNAGWFTSEYARQRPSCEYWIGLLEGILFAQAMLRGEHPTTPFVQIPKQSDLLKTACIYGYHTDERFVKFRQRRAELQQRVQHAQQIEQQKHDEAVFLSGALEGMNYDEQWLGG